MNNWLSKRFTPSQLSKIYIVFAIIGVFIVSVVVMEILAPEKKERKERPITRNILTENKTRELGLSAVTDEVTVLSKKQQKTEEQFARLKQEQDKLTKQTKSSTALARELEATKAQVKQLQEIMAERKKEESERIASIVEYQLSEKQIEQIVSPESGSNESGDAGSKSSNLPTVPKRKKSASSQFSYKSQLEDDVSNDYDEVENYQTSTTDNRTGDLFAIIETEQVVNKHNEEEIYVPKGSILTGVLLTGLDAPTASSAKDSPIPVLVRLKKEAILPNFNTVQEVRECFAIMGGYGDLSSERAFLRGEAISCVRYDGSVIEKNLSAFAVGEDGKNGLKGTLVSRNSTVLANAMMAGFAEGMASMFDVDPVPVISTDSSGTAQYASVFSSDAVQGGAAKGASSAMGKLSDYYLNLADSIHPIIEIGGGRVVDIVLTGGVDL